MTDRAALDERLSTLYPEVFWRGPSPMPAVDTGADDLDALFLGLVQARLDAAVFERVARLSADQRKHAIRDAALRWADHVIADRPPRAIAPFDPQTVSHLPLDLATRACEIGTAATSQWSLRIWLLGTLLDLLRGSGVDDALREQLVRWINSPGDPTMRTSVATALFAALPDAKNERTRWLDALVRYCEPNDPLAPIGAEALVRRDGTEAAKAIRDVLARSELWSRVATAVRVSRLHTEVDLDAFPEWADTIYPGVLGNAWAIEASYRLHTVRTAEPLIRALRHTDDELYWTDILSSLRRVDDPRSATALEALAASLPEAPKGKKVVRSKGTVLALVKRLRRKRATIDKASFEIQDGVGTDGGPILVVSKDVASVWQGVPSDWTGEDLDKSAEGAPFGVVGAEPKDMGSDYDRACAAADVGVGKLEIGGRASLVLPEQQVGVATLAMGVTMLVLAGSDIELELAMQERGAWKKTHLSLEVGDGGALLLDATATLASAPDGGVMDLPLAAGSYDVHELVATMGSGALHAVKLAPRAAKTATTKQPRVKKSGARPIKK